MTPGNPVFTGETVNLTCNIETYSDWRYEWYKGSINHAMLQTSVRHTVNRETLTIRELIKEDGDLYFCGGKRDGRPNLSKSSFAVSLVVRGELNFFVLLNSLYKYDHTSTKTFCSSHNTLILFNSLL